MIIEDELIVDSRKVEGVKCAQVEIVKRRIRG